MVEVGDRVLVESEKVGAVTHNGCGNRRGRTADHSTLGLRIVIDVHTKRRLPAGRRP